MNKLKKIFSVMLSIAMVIGLVTVSDTKVNAAEDTGSKTVYEKVDTVENGQDYIVVYNNQYALTWNGSDFKVTKGTVTNNEFKPDDANVSYDNILWTYNNGFKLKSNSDVKVAGNDNNALDSTGNYLLTVNNNSLRYTRRSSGRNYNYYLSCNGNEWTIIQNRNTINSYAQFTFYKPVQKVTRTIEWYLDGKLIETTEESVSAGKDVAISKPSGLRGRKFEKYVLDGQTYTKEIYSTNLQESKSYKFYYKSPSDFPEYPDQGSVKQTKTATPAEGMFKENGVAKVELGVTGVPMHKPVEVVVVMDLSGSMNDKVDSSSNQTRLEAAKIATEDFISRMFEDNADGSYSNNKVGLVTFSKDDSTRDKIHYELSDFTQKNNMINTVRGLTAYKGTDYDKAFELANDVLGKSTDSDVQKYVVFMTDGAPGRYNTLNYDHRCNGVYDYKTNHVLKDQLVNAEEVKSNGATVYSIGFGVAQGGEILSGGNHDDKFTGEECKAVLEKIATSPENYISAESSDELAKAFASIASSIKKAGTEAEVEDQIGNLFELQKTQTLPNNKPSLNLKPTIEVTAYDIYTRADVGTTIDGKEITLDDVGKRKGTSTIIETVTFSEDGKSATSSLKTDTNIMDINGNIDAEKFEYNEATKTFTWHIGNIGEKEVTISYYVYLKGSMEGQRGDGLYDTNEYATLKYKNYLDNDVERDFVKPKMPWGSALVNYEFYLVNEAGEPVNSRGDVIPFEHRVKISDVQQVKFNWNNAESVEAKLEASKFVPKGYTLHVTDATYTANAVSSGAGTHVISGKGESLEGSSDGNVITNGRLQSTVVYQADAQYTNSYVAFGVLNKTTLIPDSVVLDYGLPVTIDVMKNDMVMDAVLHSVGREDANIGGVELGDGSTDSISKEDFGPSIDLTNGTVAVNNGTVKYTPTKYMDSIDRFLYAAEVTTEDKDGTEINYYRYQKVSVVPATTVYYEDNFGETDNVENKGNGIVFSGDWSTEGVTDSDREQENGTTVSDGHPYGNDKGYGNDTEFSGGSAKKVVGTPNTATTASFKFKGTGFDLISRTDNNSTRIIIDVQDSEGRVSRKIVDNKYQSGTLYQIPVYEWRASNYDKGYGEYTVTITVGQSGTDCTFYLDAIRVYDPIDPNSEDAKEANEHYDDDNEANAVVTELRSILLDQYDGGTLKGAIYVDGEDTVDVDTYDNIGPNNEIYLKKGQSIGLSIHADREVASVQLGVKAPESSVTGQVKYKVGSDTDSEREYSLNTATDMYYNITDTLNFVVNDELENKTAQLVVTNTSDSDTILSLTNLKITYKEAGASTAIITDEEVVANTLRVTSKRMQPKEETPIPPVEPEKPENPANPSIKDVVDKIVESIEEKIKDFFDRFQK